MKLLPLFLSAWVALPLAVSADNPTHNIEAAQKKAAAGKKDLLLVLTGSSWSQRSKKFEQEIIGSDVFKKGIEKKFESVVVDFPSRREDASEALLEFQKKYRFREIPSVILADAAGRPYVYSGANSEDAAAFLKVLDKGQKVRVERDRLFSEGDKAKGVEQARLYVKALKTLPQDLILTFYSKELETVSKADPKGITKYVGEIKKAQALREEAERYEKALRAREFDKVVKDSSAEAAKAKGEDSQRLLLYKVRALAAQNKFQEATAVVNEITKLDPQSEFAKNVPQYLNYLKSAEQRQKRMEEAAKNPPVRKPSKPIVSKPVAIVTDINLLRKEAKEFDDAAAKAAAKVAEMKKAAAAKSQAIKDLEAQLKKAQEDEKKAAEALKQASVESEKLSRKAKAMREVVENHEAMEKRKREISELEKKAADLQKQAEALRNKAADIKKGK